MNWLNKGLAGLFISIVSIVQPGCYDSGYGGYGYRYNSGNCQPRSYSYGRPGYAGNSYSEFRDNEGRLIGRQGEVWVNGPSCRPGIGLPGHSASPSPHAIQEKFRQDVQRARAGYRR